MVLNWKDVKLYITSIDKKPFTLANYLLLNGLTKGLRLVN
jgi:hypothetical protein